LAISSSTRKAGPFLGNDATTVFPFAFKVFTAADLRVVNTSALGVESDLELDVDYTVELNTNQDNDPGGSVTRLEALPTGERLTITSNVAALQPLVLTNNGGFYPRVINDAFDKITIIAQQLIEQVGRSLKLPISSTASATLPDPVANSLIAWNSAGTGFANVAPGTLVDVAVYAEAFIKLFDGDGVETDFDLDYDPGVMANLDVSISGVTQVGGEDFTWIGTTITFLTAPPAGTRIQVRYTRVLPPVDLDAATSAAAASAAAAAEDAVATAADRVQTGLDRVATAADVVSAEADRVATAADRVQTGLDRTQTGLDRVATAADVAATADKVSLVSLALSTGAALVGAIASGVGAVLRTVQDKLRDTVSIKDFGAATTGDNTAAINAAVASGARYVIVPPGNYRVDGTVEMATFVTLRIDGTLSRLTAHSASTRPLILINNVQLCKVYGRGALVTENASPDGIVCIGPEDPTNVANQTVDTNWNTFAEVSLTGNGLGTGNIGIKMECTAAYLGGVTGHVCYQNWINCPEIHSVDKGIFAGSQVNANIINCPQMWNIGVYGVHLKGTEGSPGTYPASSITDNTVIGIFVHNSYGLSATLKCESASFNTFTAMNGEPGSGRLFDFDANSESNYLSGVENHPLAGLNAGANNTILTNANINTIAPKFMAASSATQAAATGDGTNVNVSLGTELYDTWPGGAFASSQFVAPVTGKYRLSGAIYINGLGSAHTGIDIRLVTSNRTYLVYSSAVGSQNATTVCLPWTVLADMDAGDFALPQCQVSGGAKTVNIYGDGSTATHFCGELVA